ncbi:MAG: hypothetical protein U0527_07530 [Candidatus Eisenbacteria bacterium]
MLHPVPAVVALFVHLAHAMDLAREVEHTFVRVVLPASMWAMIPDVPETISSVTRDTSFSCP